MKVFWWKHVLAVLFICASVTSGSPMMPPMTAGRRTHHTDPSFRHGPMIRVPRVGEIPVSELDQLQLTFGLRLGHRHMPSEGAEGRVPSADQVHIKSMIETRNKLLASAARLGVNDDRFFLLNNEEDRENSKTFKEAVAKLKELHRKSLSFDRRLRLSTQTGDKIIPCDMPGRNFIDPEFRKWTHPNRVPARKYSLPSVAEMKTKLSKMHPLISKSIPWEPFDDFNSRSIQSHIRDLRDLLLSGYARYGLNYHLPPPRP